MSDEIMATLDRVRSLILQLSGGTPEAEVTIDAIVRELQNIHAQFEQQRIEIDRLRQIAYG